MSIFLTKFYLYFTINRFIFDKHFNIIISLKVHIITNDLKVAKIYVFISDEARLNKRDAGFVDVIHTDGRAR